VLQRVAVCCTASLNLSLRIGGVERQFFSEYNICIQIILSAHKKNVFRFIFCIKRELYSFLRAQRVVFRTKKKDPALQCALQWALQYAFSEYDLAFRKEIQQFVHHTN